MITRVIAAVIVLTLVASGCGGRGEGTVYAGIGDTLQRAIEDADAPAVSVAVRLPDGSVWTGARGAEIDTPFRLASITKTYVAALAMVLVEEGVLDLDEPVELAGVGRDATLRHLLSHSSGMPNQYEPPAAPWTEDDLVTLASAVCSPGTCFEYADLGFIAAGLLMERETGEPLEELLRTRLFEPHGLDQTWFAAGAVPRGIARPHRFDGVAEDAAFLTDFGRITWASGAMAATASDVLAWGEALFGGEVVSEESLAELTDGSRTLEIRCAVDCYRPYGLGVALGRTQGHAAFSHGGSTGTLLVHLPGQGVTAAVLTNRAGAAEAVMRSVLKAVGVADRADVYVIDADGTNLRRLTTAPEVDGAPSWSPDGGRVVFGSARDGNPEIYVMDADGSNQRRLTDDPARDVAGHLVGERVVFTSDRSGNQDIWSMALDGSDLRQQTRGEGDEAFATPSPDGRRLVVELPGRPAIAIMNADGTDLVEVALPGVAAWPSWSPTGDRILYGEPGRGLRTVRPDGTDPVVVSTDTGDRLPAWGSSGRIAFVNSQDAWTMRPDGSDRRRLTRSDAEEFHPVWSPDGRQLLLTSDRS